MPDVTGFRAKFAVIVPSTNTVMEADCARLAIPGVTYHTGRMYIESPALDSDAAFEQLLAQVDKAFEVALRDVMTVKPDYLVMGMSAPTFWGGKNGNDTFVERAEALSGLSVCTGADSCRRALLSLGVKRIGVLTPYQPIMRRQIVRYFEEVGFEVTQYVDLKCPSATAIAEVTEQDLIPVLKSLAGDDVEAIVQAGTNLSMVGLAAQAEKWLQRPVVAINSAILWRSYRANGFDDRIYDSGSLLREF
jgi:maleate isomerase